MPPRRRSSSTPGTSPPWQTTSSELINLSETSVVDPDLNWICIYELFWSGSVFQKRIWIYTTKNRLDWLTKIDNVSEWKGSVPDPIWGWDPDPNLDKFQDPDLNTMYWYLDLKHCIRHFTSQTVSEIPNQDQVHDQDTVFKKYGIWIRQSHADLWLSLQHWMSHFLFLSLYRYF